MNETSLSLLNRLRRSPDAESWDRVAKLYSPLIRAWLRRYDVEANDADDLVQEVLLAISENLGEFEHAGHPGAFRGWLRAILVNRLRKFWRARDRRPETRGDAGVDGRLTQLDDPSSAVTLIWDREHDHFVLRQLMTLAEPHFEPVTWKAFCRVALEGVQPEVAAGELGISRNAVIVAKCRVLNRLRRESEGLIASASGFLAEC